MRLSLFLTSEEKEISKAIKYMLGVKPKNVHLYKQAFRHKSAAFEVKHGVKNSNERLEYLGDSVLNTIIADYLFLKFPYKDEGYLTEMRSRIVNRNQLNTIAQKIGLEQLIHKNSDNHNHNTSIPGNALEALIGALYIDQGFNVTRKIVIKRIVQVFLDISNLENININYKSKLIEWAQKEKKHIYFKVLDTQGSAKHLKHIVGLFINDELITKADGFSVKKAEKNAAELAFRKLVPIED